MCGIAQPIPNFCRSQDSWLLPYSAWVKGRQGEKGSLWVSSPLCSLEPRPCTTRACDIPLWCPPRPSMDRLSGSGEKLEDPRKKREFCRFIPSLGKGRHWLWRLGEKEEGWGAGRKGIKQPGARVLTELVVVGKLHFRAVLPKLCELGTRAELFVFPTLRATGTVSRACELSRGLWKYLRSWKVSLALE